MLRQQLNSPHAPHLQNAGENNTGNYGATNTNNEAEDAAEVETLSYTDTQGDENDATGSGDGNSDSDLDNDTATDTNNTDERSGLLSSLGGSFTRRHRRNHSNASGSLQTLNTIDDMLDGGASRARAGSFVSYSTSTLVLERTKQTLWYCFELFFPSEDDDEDAADDGTFDPFESPDVRRNYNINGNSSNHLYSSTTRHRIAVIFNCFLLAIAYSAERSTFKVLVDKAGPFRLLSAEVITGLHALVLGLGMAAGKASRYFAAKKQGQEQFGNIDCVSAATASSSATRCGHCQGSGRAAGGSGPHGRVRYRSLAALGDIWKRHSARFDGHSCAIYHSPGCLCDGISSPKRSMQTGWWCDLLSR